MIRSRPLAGSAFSQPDKVDFWQKMRGLVRRSEMNNQTGKKKKDRSTRELLPAVIFVAAVTQIPFVITIVFSFLNWNVKRPDLGIKFNGIKNK